MKGGPHLCEQKRYDSGDNSIARPLVFHIKILVQRSDDQPAVAVVGFNQGVTVGVVSRAVDSVAKGHAKHTKPQVIRV